MVSLWKGHLNILAKFKYFYFLDFLNIMCSKRQKYAHNKINCFILSCLYNNIIIIGWVSYYNINILLWFEIVVQSMWVEIIFTTQTEIWYNVLI